MAGIILLDREKPKKTRKYPRSMPRTKFSVPGGIVKINPALGVALLSDPRSFAQGELPLGQFKAAGSPSAGNPDVRKSDSRAVVEAPPSEKTSRHRKSPVPELEKGRDGLYPTIYRDKHHCGPAFRFNWEIECEKVVDFIEKLRSKGIPVLYMYNTRHGEQKRTEHHYISIDGRSPRQTDSFLSDAQIRQQYSSYWVIKKDSGSELSPLRLTLSSPFDIESRRDAGGAVTSNVWNQIEQVAQVINSENSGVALSSGNNCMTLSVSVEDYLADSRSQFAFVRALATIHPILSYCTRGRFDHGSDIEAWNSYIEGRIKECESGRKLDSLTGAKYKEIYEDIATPHPISHRYKGVFATLYYYVGVPIVKIKSIYDDTPCLKIDFHISATRPFNLRMLQDRAAVPLAIVEFLKKIYPAKEKPDKLKVADLKKADLGSVWCTNGLKTALSSKKPEEKEAAIEEFIKHADEFLCLDASMHELVARAFHDVKYYRYDAR